MKRNLNVALSVMTSGSSTNSEIINFCLTAENGYMFYAERTDFKIINVNKNETNKLIFNNQKYNFKESYKNETSTNDNKILTLIKDHDDVIKKEINEWFNKISDMNNVRVTFWVDNPVAWLFFIEIAFMYRSDSPDIPEFINPYPMDLNTMSQLIEYNKSIEDLYPDAGDEVEFNSLFRSQMILALLKNIFNPMVSNTQSDISKDTAKIKNKGTKKHYPKKSKNKKIKKAVMTNGN